MLKRDREPAIWPYAQEFTGPDGQTRTRRGFLAKVRLEAYGPGGVRPHERTQPGPKEDRLRLTRATRHNLSPIFALHAGDAWQHLEPALGDAWGEATDDDGTVHRVWRVADPAVHDAIAAELADSELLIADGHHRYETARAYEAEVGAEDEGPHSFVLMSLVSLDDPGLAVFPTHRLLHGLTRSAYQALGERDPRALRHRGGRDGRTRSRRRGGRRRLRARRLAPQAGLAAAAARTPQRSTRRCPTMPDAYRDLDAVILETLVLRGLMGMSTEDIAAQSAASPTTRTRTRRSLDRVRRARCLFMLRPTPVEAVREVRRRPARRCRRNRLTSSPSSSPASSSTP